MPNPYINFMKQHPQLQGETAQHRIIRVASLWQQLKQQQGSGMQQNQTFGKMMQPNPYGYIY